MANKKNNRLWDYLGAITHSKDLTVLNDPDFDKVYDPFIINRALSQHEDSLLAAQMVNERPDMPKSCQFLFLLNTLRARKRYGEWLKFTVSDDVKSVAEYYGCTQQQARDLVALHTPEQLAVIARRLDKGGVSKSHAGTKNSSAPRRGGHS